MSEIRDFCEAISGKWIQVKNENMDAINSGSGMDWVTRKVAGMMTVFFQSESIRVKLFSKII